MDIGKYQMNKQFVVAKYHERKSEDLCSLTSELAVATMVPCIAIAYWLGEAAGWPDQIVEQVKSLIKFYQYGEIKNKPPGSPL